MEDHNNQASQKSTNPPSALTLSPGVPISQNVPNSRGGEKPSSGNNHARYRSGTVIKERLPQQNNEFSTLRGEGSQKGLPNIKFSSPSALKYSQAMSKYFKGVVEKAIDQDKAGRVFDMNTYNSSFRNYYKAVRTQQNNTTLETGYLPKLNLKAAASQHNNSVLSGGQLTTDRKAPLDGGFRIPTPLLCKRYHKGLRNQNNTTHHSPRDDDKQTIDPSQLSSIPSLRRLEGTTYKKETFNRAFYMWNQWNFRDESIQSATKHKIRDQIHVMKEEYRIQKYQQELISIQKKRNLIEQYYREHNVRLPQKFNQQRCSTNQLHIKLATIYHRDRANKAATIIQRWFREFQKRQLKSRRYWYMLRGIFKFKYTLRKFRDRMEKRLRDFDLRVNRAAIMIQKCFKGYMVRKEHGKTLAMRRIERNYKQFYDKRVELLEMAQCKIAYVWRMNRIKIKLARKKREKEDAAKKKAMGKDKVTAKFTTSKTTVGGKVSNASSLKAKATAVANMNRQASVTIQGSKQAESPTPAKQAGSTFKKGTLKITTVVTAAQEASKTTPLTTFKSEKGIVSNQGSGALGNAPTNASPNPSSAEPDSNHQDSVTNLKSGYDSIANLEIHGEIDEEKSGDEKSSDDEDSADGERIAHDIIVKEAVIETLTPYIITPHAVATPGSQTSKNQFVKTNSSGPKSIVSPMSVVKGGLNNSGGFTQMAAHNH